ncbi:MAG: DUF1573 domain-containing protein [Paludibacteraceae bacterium]|nr:DUF1573 domain-containing protein [Paludibacteraceae bacterium]
MKKSLLISMMLMIAGLVMAQQAVITFTRMEHDFGKINEADGRVSTVFEFKNEGMEPLVLSNVKASCGCTTPTWTKTPIEPGQTGAITVTYNPNGRPGRFQKTVTITSNATEPTKKVIIKGEVIPKAAQPVNKYPVKMGDLSLAKKEVKFGNVLKGKDGKASIEYANLTDHNITISALVKENDPIEAVISLPAIEKGKSGQIDFLFDTQHNKLYGQQEYTVYIVIDGQVKKDADHEIKLSANVEEDFSVLTPEELQNAPILEVERMIDLGTIVPGKKVKKSFNVKNAGLNSLEIRRLYNPSSDTFFAKVNKTSIKNGKTAAITIECDGKKQGVAMKPGEYRRNITLITNDPKTPKMNVTISWKIAE